MGDIMNERFVSKTLKQNLIIFSIGAVGYMLIELLWRGKTHWSMGIAGGICFAFFGKIWGKIKNLPKIYVPIVGATIITCVELIFGIIFNILLKKRVWDYSHLPFNFLGQISLLFTTLWGFLSTVFMPLAGKFKMFLSKVA